MSEGYDCRPDGSDREGGWRFRARYLQALSASNRSRCGRGYFWGYRQWFAEPWKPGTRIKTWAPAHPPHSTSDVLSRIFRFPPLPHSKKYLWINELILRSALDSMMALCHFGGISGGIWKCKWGYFREHLLASNSRPVILLLKAAMWSPQRLPMSLCPRSAWRSSR